MFSPFYFSQMAQPIPSLIDKDLEYNELTLEDLGPLSHYWMLVKFIVIYPGVELETFEVAQCKIGEDGVSTLLGMGSRLHNSEPGMLKCGTFCLLHRLSQLQEF